MRLIPSHPEASRPVSRRSIRLLLGILCVTVLIPPTYAAAHYIRAGATGANNGTSWANAWPSFGNVTWARGDTYYVAGGIYNENVTVNRPLSGTTWLTIKKANAADNSADSGWDAAYATNQAIINGYLQLYYGYTEFDGVTGSGTTGHGFKIHVTDPNQTILFRLAAPQPYHISHTEVMGPGFGSTFTGSDGIHQNNALGSAKGVRVDHCWVHDVTRDGFTFTGHVGSSYSDYGFLIEDCVISETGGCLNLNNHGQGIMAGYASPSSFNIIRNSVFRNVAGTACIALLGNSGTQHTAQYHDYLIYNNCFYITDNQTYHPVAPGPIVSISDAESCANVIIIGNSFYNIGPTPGGGTVAQCAIDTPGATGCVLANNVWENCYFSTKNRGFDLESNNGYFGNTGAGVPTASWKQVDGSSTTFANPSAGDFRILATGYGVGKGRNFPEYFSTDAAGLTRGGVWDIGAFQLQTTGDAPPTNPIVKITVQP